MPVQLLTTKLFVPPSRPATVARPGLLERLEAGIDRGVTVVSAPAGFGKTTLVAQWAAEHAKEVAWLSLDEDDGDLVRFLSYVVAAIRTVAPEVGVSLQKRLSSGEPQEAEALLTELLNDIAATTEGSVTLVLDDYHAVESQEVDAALAFLVGHLPARLRIVIASREDPPLPLGRMRARGRLSEIRLADLRFSAEEAGEFLREVMHVELSSHDVAALERRTEGWIAGLQLAAVSMRGTEDPSRFIASFTGSNRFVLDYLLDEVFDRQPEDVQRFLLATSILDRLCAPLCEAVLTERDVDGQEMLRRLERANLFLVPLDSDREWYRYHHLFRDLLRSRIREEETSLHRRASRWFEDNGFRLEAFHHATRAGDLDAALRLVRGDGVPLYFRGAALPVLRWLESMPESAFMAQPELLVHHAWVLWTAHRSTRVEPVLLKAEAVLAAAGGTADAQRPAPTAAVRSRLRGHIAALRALLAGNNYDTRTIIAQSKVALRDVSKDALYVRTAVTRTLGMAYHIEGQRAEARRTYEEAIAMSEASDNLFINILTTTGLGILEESENRLHRAEQAYRRVIELVGDPSQPVACEACLGLARLAYERNELDAAERYANHGIGLAERIESIDTPVAGRITVARVRMARGDFAAADEILARAAAWAEREGFDRQTPVIAEHQVLSMIRQGRLEEAGRLAREQESPVSLVRLELAKENPEAALAALEPYAAEVNEKGWTDGILKARILKALALHQSGDGDTAVETLAGALAAVESEGFVRTFVDEGELMADLLGVLAGRRTMPAYVEKLRAAFRGAGERAGRFPGAALVEPLTRRELEVLRLVAQGLSNREIGEKLFVSIPTVKGHNLRIFEKLRVKRRTEAVARAREMGLL